MITTALFIALQFEVVGPCSPKPLFSKIVRTDAVSVGEATVKTFLQHNVPFQGNERGMNSIYETPTDDRTLEIISDREMRSYGWCYEVDGKGPEDFADEVYLTQKTRSIKWFYGFAHYKDGQWISQCEPAHKIKPRAICN